MTQMEILEAINEKMHPGFRCPTAGCLGECAFIDSIVVREDGKTVYEAELYIWDEGFHDSAEVARWFHDLGAAEVVISHALYDDWNGDRDGKTEDGCRHWVASYVMEKE